jgi:hypothetical protein
MSGWKRSRPVPSSRRGFALLERAALTDLACILATRSSCEATPTKDPTDGVIVDNGATLLPVA